jgi:hypothetical protein
MFSRTLALMVLSAIATMGQEAASQPAEPQEKTYPVVTGTKVLLRLVNSVSTKNAQAGDSVYLETAFPVFANGRLVIPPGSYVMGTITASVRPGKVKGKGELFLRFDSLTFPNGVTRDFHAALSNMDGSKGTLDRAESGVKSDGNVGGDMATIGKIGLGGAGVGGMATWGQNRGMGVGIGGAAGAAAGLATVLLTRGPDAVLQKGTSVEMLLDRELIYTDSELEFSRSAPSSATGAQPRSDGRPVLQRR